MLELVNQARMNPQAAAAEYTTNLTPDVQATLNYYNVNLSAVQQAIANSAPKAPLAWNPDLAAAAQSHTQDMVNNNFQSHTGTDGSTADQRMQQSGYTNATTNGENAFAYATSVDEAMEAFLIDWGVPDSGHRRNLLQANVSSANAFTDTGIGIAPANPNSKVGPLVITQDFGSQSNNPAQLVGVVYSDPNHTGMYQLNSGQGNVQIDATNLLTGQTTSVQTWATGGYQIPLAPGKYQVTASLNDTVIQTTQVNIGSENVEQDFLTNGQWDGRTREQVLASVTPQPATPAPAAPVAPAPASAAPAAPVSVTVIPTSNNPTSNSTGSGASTGSSSSSNGSWTSWKANTV